jgi:hypothetical protein
MTVFIPPELVAGYVAVTGVEMPLFVMVMVVIGPTKAAPDAVFGGGTAMTTVAVPSDLDGGYVIVLVVVNPIFVTVVDVYPAKDCDGAPDVPGTATRTSSVPPGVEGGRVTV